MPAEALAHFVDDKGAVIRALGTGLINRTYLVESGAGRFVLQWVNPIFDPAIHHNIEAVTKRLVARGVSTPELVRTRAGELWATVGGSVWRLMTFIDGVSFDMLSSAAQARAAGELLGRFHRALEDLEHPFVALRNIHDTPRHLEALRDAIAAHADRRLHAEVARLGERVAASAAKLPALPPLLPRVCHGDLKISNVLFDQNERAICLIDLDTVGPMHLGHELGDAWRSWCNPALEDDPAPRFDVDLFGASLDGYRDGLKRALDSDERAALLHGVEWIALELAARFAADALRDRYFGWDANRYDSRPDHNLARARSQLALHEAIVATRPARATALR
ncbi:MAG TPA: phosphotransferase [Polyangiaceae bacterium]|nr:phosphotransferase [Polyangiaceae bacterium]